MIDKNRVSKTAIEAYKRTLEPKNTKTGITYRERLIQLLQDHNDESAKKIFDEFFCSGSKFNQACQAYTSTRGAMGIILDKQYGEV